MSVIESGEVAGQFSQSIGEADLSLDLVKLKLSPVLSRKAETRAKAVSNSILLAPVGNVRLFFDDPSLDSEKKSEENAC